MTMHPHALLSLTAEQRTPAPIPALRVAAFVETEGLTAVLAQLQGHRAMARVRLSVTQGGLGAALEACAKAMAAPILLLETRADRDALMARLDALAELCDPATRVLVIGSENDVTLYRALLRRGVSDYLPHPVTAAQMLRVLAEMASPAEALAKAPVVAFLGASGGAGSTTVALSTAWLWGRARGVTCCLLDLDPDFGTAGLALGYDQAAGMGRALQAAGNLDMQMLEGLTQTHDGHLRLIAGRDAAGPHRAAATEAVDHLIDLTRAMAPLVALDVPRMGPRMGPDLTPCVTRQALVAADRVVITATPDLAGLRHCRRLLDHLAELRPEEDPPLLVLNKLGAAPRGKVTARDFCQTLGMEVTAQVPFDPRRVARALDAGRVAAAGPGGRRIARALGPLVAALSAGTAPRAAARRPMLARLLGR